MVEVAGEAFTSSSERTLDELESGDAGLILAAWDPGLRESGLAIFDNGRLIHAQSVYADSGYVNELQWLAMAQQVGNICKTADVQKFAFEGMSTRPGRTDAHRNLIMLTFISGLTAGRLGVPFREVPANLWTHGRKKAINHRLIERELDETEMRVLKQALESCPKKTNHKEIYDAIGIGLHCVRRWK